MKFTKDHIILILKLCTVSVFFGRAYEHIFFDAPYRSILWDENIFSPLVEVFFNMDWDSYVTSIPMDNRIQSFIFGIGIFYVVCGLLSILITRRTYRVFKYIMWVGVVSLVLLATLQAKSNFNHFAMFFEHTLQFGSPIALLLLFKIERKWNLYVFFLKIIIALTFLSHGLYAIGWPYPLPGNFVTMTMNILPLSEDSAKFFLLIAGCLDFLVAFLIFVPKTVKAALIYASVWGILTAMARIVSGLTYDFSLIIFHQYFYTAVFRIPHGLIPLLTFFIITKVKRSVFEFQKYN